MKVRGQHAAAPSAARIRAPKRVHAYALRSGDLIGADGRRLLVIAQPMQIARGTVYYVPLTRLRLLDVSTEELVTFDVVHDKPLDFFDE